MTVDIDVFLSLRNQAPILDVRSESEFRDGHIQGAINIPILNNEERKIVGTLYKQQGKNAAIKEGISLVGPRLSSIIEQAESCAKDNTLLVHCWRGGMRSANFCWLIERLGYTTYTLEGGYKAYRQQAMEYFESPLKLISLSGSTGSGKTSILHALVDQGAQVLDLEGLANHKGSAFGGVGLGDQPTTEQFQNELFEKLYSFDRTKPIWVEDESIAVGKIFIPQPIWRQMRDAPIVAVEVEKAVRIDRLVVEYGKADKEELIAAMEKITKKLGGQHFNNAKQQLLDGNLGATADILLTYYDKAYGNALEKRKSNIKYTTPFDWKDVNAFASQLIDETKNFI